MRVLRLTLLGLVAYVLAVLWFFPAAPVVERFRPQLPQYVSLEDVSGRVLAGNIARARYTDDLLPLEFSDVGWRLKPLSIISGAALDVNFTGYGGGGEGNILRKGNGDIAVSDVSVTAQAKALEPLLPAPVASFSGDLEMNVERLLLQEQLLKAFAGDFVWKAARLERPFPANFGDVTINVKPADDNTNTHRALITASGGDVTAEGEIVIFLNGDFNADVLLTPTVTASQELRDNLARIGRPDSSGRIRWVQQGNASQM
ncbi:MAG: hypothetical protein CSA54_03745 [Gammaproteobacteria bacterium]|nr:MAG: hypothetical protein CSA54_03745 [Gammaproteobacteria bacterium]